jgi:hypothetical protein
VYIDPAFTGIYTFINKHYTQYGNIPSFDELEASLRDTGLQKSLTALTLADTLDISSEVALDALIDQYTQNEAIKLLDKYIDKLPLYDTKEIKENLSSIVLTLDEKTYSAEGVYSMDNIMLFIPPEDIAKSRFQIGRASCRERV